MAVTQHSHHRGGLSTMAYILVFAAAMFLALVSMFALLARYNDQPVPVEPVKPAPHDVSTQYG